MFEGQYIGTVDKNNKKVCEGHKLKGIYKGKEFTGTVFYHQRSCSFLIETNFFKYFRPDKLKAEIKGGEVKLLETEIIG